MRRPRGAVNLVSLTLLAAAVTGAYLGWIYIPLWLDDLDVREALAAGAGQLVSENTSLDAPMIQKMVATRLSRVGTHWEEQEGKQLEVPGLGVEPADVELERAPDGKTGRVSLDYARTVKLRPLNRYWTLRFHTSREGRLRP
ncbi:MAG TPA: hypothetical protein VLQ79_13620 [Myxococcaceae bacterium]|nr:hypothetical protein [Myxococcaceae bacterium]